MKRALMYIIVLFVLSSCKYEFDGFPDTLLCWIPYNIGDSLQYTNEQDTIVFEVTDFYKTGYKSYRGFAMDVWWDYEAYYITNEHENGYQIYERFSKNVSSSSDDITIKLSNTDIFTFNPWQNKASSKSDSIDVRYVSDTIIENINYREVYTLNKTKMNNTERIKWIIKAKDKGIIQFYDNKTEKKWCLIN